MQGARAAHVVQRSTHSGDRGAPGRSRHSTAAGAPVVLSVPKRLRWYLEREPQALSAVLQILLLHVIEAQLRRSSGASSHARLGAVSSILRSGASLSRHIHSHCCVIDGVFEPVEDADDFPESARLAPPLN